MEALFILISIVLILVVLFVKGVLDEKKREKKIRKEIHEDFGKQREKRITDEEWKSIPGYFHSHRDLSGKEKRFVLDEITWNDLNMDVVFERLNHTYSSSGQEYLYDMLRTPGMNPDNTERTDKRIKWFASHEKEREELQYQFYRLGKTGRYSIYDYLMYLEDYEQHSIASSIIADVLMLAALCFLPYHPSPSLTALFVLLCIQLYTYARKKSETEGYLVSLAYVKRLLDFSERIRKLEISVLEQEWTELKLLGKQFGKFRFGALLGMRGSRIAGDPLSLLMDYVNMIFHLDILASRAMLAEVNSHMKEIDRMIEITGRIEAEIAIASFRASLKEGWCIPEFTDENSIRISEMYHPLLDEPVKNSIETSKGVLVTGSNASGKSTFLKTAALNAVLAQSIDTCTAAYYSAPVFEIYSSMALRDDLEGGESYYMAEIRSLKRIMDRVKKDQSPILCFVDEVLRGTNTVERIAASVQILKKLNGPGVICFAATHDIELTELLKDHYENYHFEETVKAEDICFDYRLLSGKAVTRNAIRLLALIGYEEEIIDEANEMAAEYLETGAWKA